MPIIKRRVHTRTRRLSLRVKADGSIVLTHPPRVSESLVQEFLRESQDWLSKQWQRVLEQPALPVISMPETGILYFPLLQRQIAFHLRDDLKGRKVVEQQEELYIPAVNAREIMRQWVLEQAKQHLPERLQALAQKHQFKYQHCTIRHAKTRWGSCSGQGNISLNAALMLLPVELLDYVLLHELCHTRQMNHSDKFWREMQKVDPLFQSHRLQLKQFKSPVWWQ